MSFLLFDPIWRPLGANGQVLPGCTLTFYESGTTTPAAVYADADLTTPLTNPVEADAAGNLPAIYGDSATVYRRQLHDADGVLLSDVDPIHPHVQFPPGTLMMFKGSEEDRDEAYPPSLWELCDGDNDTPDTRDRFPVGVSNTKPISGDASTGGSASGTINTSSAGGHSHSVTVDGHTLTVSEIPAHGHDIFAANRSGDFNADGWGGSNTRGIPGHNNGPFGARTSSIAGDQLIRNTGGGQAHSHGASSGSVAGHTHTVNRADIAPPYFTVWFLLRKAS